MLHCLPLIGLLNDALEELFHGRHCSVSMVLFLLSFLRENSISSLMFIAYNWCLCIKLVHLALSGELLPSTFLSRTSILGAVWNLVFNFAISGPHLGSGTLLASEVTEGSQRGSHWNSYSNNYRDSYKSC